VATAARLGNRVDVGLLAGCIVLSLIAVVLKDDQREPIASALRRTIVAPLVGLQRGAERWRGAWMSSEARQLQVDSLAMRAISAQALRSENDDLRRVAGLGSRLQWGFVPAEALNSSQPSGDVITTLTLTAGSNAGVQQYSPVVAPDGLVGTIKKADPTISIAILYTDPDFRASAMSADGTAFGIIYPHPAGVGGSDSYMLELRGVPTRVTLKPGAAVYTSGLGGTFPRGIAIGTIVRVLKTPEDVWTRTYLVQPSVAPSKVTTVLILTPQRVTQGTGNVWGAVVNADSATKRIATAGDSIAARALVLDAQARAAALDSVRKATIDSVRRALGAPAAAVPGAVVHRDTTTTRVRRDTAPRVVTPPDTTRPDTTRDPVRP
jgi:rod shape-determining protein MreC